MTNKRKLAKAMRKYENCRHKDRLGYCKVLKHYIDNETGIYAHCGRCGVTG